MRRDLVDTFVLIVHPLVLGKGHRLFAEQGPAEKFRLIDSAATQAGVFVGTYGLRAA
jgi:dihydrofolate reductase